MITLPHNSIVITPTTRCILSIHQAVIVYFMYMYIYQKDYFFKSSLAFISSCILIHNKLCPKSTSIISYNTEFLVSGPYIDLLEDHLGGGVIQKCDQGQSSKQPHSHVRDRVSCQLGIFRSEASTLSTMLTRIHSLLIKGRFPHDYIWPLLGSGCCTSYLSHILKAQITKTYSKGT